MPRQIVAPSPSSDMIQDLLSNVFPGSKSSFWSPLIAKFAELALVTINLRQHRVVHVEPANCKRF